MDYQLTITVYGQHPAHRTVTGDTPADLAQAVHQHVRGLLGWQVDIQIDVAALTGTIVQHHAHAGEFGLKPIEHKPTPAPDTSAPDHVAHGYTLRDLNRAARAACVSNRTATLDFTLRHNTAWSAIAEHLISAEQQPTFHDLVCAGSQAIYEDDRAAQRMYGVTTDRNSGRVVLRPRFTAYWATAPADPPDEVIVDRMAVHQILRTLPENQQQAVVALAVLGDYQKAADSLGLTYKAFVVRIGRARKAFRVLWFSPDAAPRRRGTDRRVCSRAGISDHCPQGHEFTPENTTRQHRRRGRICRACKRARGVARRQAEQGLAVAV